MKNGPKDVRRKVKSNPVLPTKTTVGTPTTLEEWKDVVVEVVVRDTVEAKVEAASTSI